MRIEPAVSVRKSSHKKQKRLREKELGRALAAADSVSSPAVSPGLTPGQGAVLACGDSVMEAGCAALSCLTQVVLCCKGFLPLAARLGVEDVVHKGLGLLKRLNLGGHGGSSRGRSGGGATRASGGMEFEHLLPLGDRRAMRGFIMLAHACLVTPLVSRLDLTAREVPIPLHSAADSGVHLLLFIALCLFDSPCSI